MLKSRDSRAGDPHPPSARERAPFCHPGPERAGLLGRSAGRLLMMLANPRGVGSTPLFTDDGGGQRRAVTSELPPTAYMRWLTVRDLRGTISSRFASRPRARPSPPFSPRPHPSLHRVQRGSAARHQTRPRATSSINSSPVAGSRTAVRRPDGAPHLSRPSTTTSPSTQEQNRSSGRRSVSSRASSSKAEGTRRDLQSRFDFLTTPEAEPLAVLSTSPASSKLHATLRIC